MANSKRKTIAKGFDFDDLTYDEAELFEDIAGGFPMPDGEGNMSFAGLHVTRATKAMAFILARREDPDVTLEELGGLKFGAHLTISAGGDDADPS